MRCFLLIAVSLLASPLAAQGPGNIDEPRPRFRFGLGFAPGRLDYETRGSALDDDASAALFRFEFEGLSKNGIGGGVRIEGIGSEDLFGGAGFDSADATIGSLFGHFTYRMTQHRFVMPLRIGLFANALELEDRVLDNDITFKSFGPYFEVAPEVVLTRSGRTEWSLYGVLGTGFGVTSVDIRGDSNDYDSTTWFLGAELGTRLSFGTFELNLSYIGRWQSMDRSNEKAGLVVLGNDVAFQGLLLGFGIVF